MPASHVALFLLNILFVCGCAQAPAQTTKTAASYRSTTISVQQTARTTRYVVEVERVGGVLAPTEPAGPGTAEISRGGIGASYVVTQFPVGQTISIKSGNTYLFSGCREVDVQATQLVRSGIVWNSVGKIKCVNGLKTEEAVFECGGTVLDVELTEKGYLVKCNSPRENN